MSKRDTHTENDTHGWGEDPKADEVRPIRFPVKPRSDKSRPATKTKGIAPDAKRYNDDIPDPDAEETIPE